MVSSSLDTNIKELLSKDTSVSSESNTNTNNSITKNNGSDLIGATLPPNEKLQLLFPKCKPRNDSQYMTSATTQDTQTARKFNSIPITQFSETHERNSVFSMNHSNYLKLQSSSTHADNKNLYTNSSYLSEPGKKVKMNNKNEQSESFLENTPFGGSSRYFCAPNDSLLNNNSGMASNSGMMNHYNFPPFLQRNYQMIASEDCNYYFEPDEEEHNPYMVMPSSTVNTLPASVLKASPPATPPALSTSPADLSPIGGSRNIWNLSPIKTNTQTQLKTQSPTSNPMLGNQRGPYKKILVSPVPIEEDLETGHYHYNNKKTYYQAPQTDSDSSEQVKFSDCMESEKSKLKSFYPGTRLKNSESSDYIYAEVKKKCERKIKKSKSAIMGKVSL